ncbi:unnamed protein product, partial [Meganyctiphanes norvegica]
MLMPGAALPATLSTSGISTPVLSQGQALEAAVTQGISQKDTTFTKIFVGGLPYHTTDKSLREHFEVYGEIEEAVVITDRQTGKSRGYGFVTMADKGGADRAIKEPNPVIDGRKANVNLAYLGAKPRGPAAGIPLTGVRYPAVNPSIYGIHPNYVYHPSLMQTAAGFLPMAATAPIAHAGNLAATQAYYDYAAQAATAAYPAAYPTATAAALEPYATAAAVSAGTQQATQAISPGTAASAMYGTASGIPGYSWQQAAAAQAAAAAAGNIPLSYATQPQIAQEAARMQ